MCLILFAYKMHPDYPLIVAANRDEFYKRETEPAHYWQDHPHILAGRDLEKRGTWMGVNQEGRFAALTNFRDPKESSEGKRSRGEIVVNALDDQVELKNFLSQLQNEDSTYPGYNLLAGDPNELYYYSNRGRALEKLTPGIYGVSNHFLNTEWPKVQTGKVELSAIIKENPGKKALQTKLFELLNKDQPYDDHLLPSTGVSLEWERKLSPLFIQSEDYGTRSQTVMLMADQAIHYVERSLSNGEVKEKEFLIDL